MNCMYLKYQQLIWIVLFTAFTVGLKAQPPIDIGKETEIKKEYTNQLEFWEDSVATFSNDLQKKIMEDERLEVCYAMIPILVKALKQENAFSYPFDNLEFISKIYAPDSTFRILTWFVRLDDVGYKYFGTLQMNDESKQLLPFFHEQEPIENLVKETLPLNKWYGAMYYNVTKVSYDKKDYYMLYGWDGNNLLTHKKVLDVLHFKEGKPVLGAPIIEYESAMQQGTFNRVFLEYNKGATVNLNYDDELKMIVFDHIVPEDGKSFGMYPTYIPDGTYEALRFEKGVWRYVEKVFHQTQDEAPIPAPLFKDKGPLPVELPKNNN